MSATLDNGIGGESRDRSWVVEYRYRAVLEVLGCGVIADGHGSSVGRLWTQNRLCP